MSLSVLLLLFAQYIPAGSVAPTGGGGGGSPAVPTSGLSAGASSSFGTTVAATAANHPAGSTLMYGGSFSFSCAGTTLGMSNTAGDTWIQIGIPYTSPANVCVTLWQVKSSAGNATDVVTFNIGASVIGTERSLAGGAMTGMTVAAPLDASTTGDYAASAGSTTSAALTTTAAAEVIWYFGNAGTGATWVAGPVGGVTATLDAAANTGDSAAEYRIVSSTQTGITANIQTVNPNASISARAVTFK